MHAAARGEIGSGIVDGELAAGALEEVVAGVGIELTKLMRGAETPLDFASSFFHMGHLDVENWILEVALRRVGSELRLRRVNIVQQLVAVNKNGRWQIWGVS
jgi:hypothetical protein